VVDAGSVLVVVVIDTSVGVDVILFRLESLVSTISMVTGAGCLTGVTCSPASRPLPLILWSTASATGATATVDDSGMDGGSDRSDRCEPSSCNVIDIDMVSIGCETTDADDGNDGTAGPDGMDMDTKVDALDGADDDVDDVVEGTGIGAGDGERSTTDCVIGGKNMELIDGADDDCTEGAEYERV
jgi:hypothetical protein